MSILESLFGKKVVYGRIGTFRIVLKSLGDESSDDDRLYHFFRETRRELRSDVRGLIRSEFGEDVELKSFEVGRGSVELIVTIGTAYYVIASWKSFMESIDLLRIQLDLLFSRWARRPGNLGLVNADATWIPAAGLSHPVDGKRTFGVGVIAGLMLALLLTYVSSLFGDSDVDELDARLSTLEKEIKDGEAELSNVKNSINRLLLYQDTAIELQLRDIRSTHNGLEDIRDVLDALPKSKDDATNDNSSD